MSTTSFRRRLSRWARLRRLYRLALRIERRRADRLEAFIERVTQDMATQSKKDLAESAFID